MNRKTRRSPRASDPGSDPASDAGDEDTALRSLSRTERVKLDIDSWEPSLLRALLEAQNKLKSDRR